MLKNFMASRSSIALQRPLSTKSSKRSMKDNVDMMVIEVKSKSETYF